jgi:hypothetical protein
MSNYSVITDYATKDSLSHGDPTKLVRGTELAAEFAAISTAISSKGDAVPAGASTISYTSSYSSLFGSTVQTVNDMLAQMTLAVKRTDYVPNTGAAWGATTDLGMATMGTPGVTIPATNLLTSSYAVECTSASATNSNAGSRVNGATALVYRNPGASSLGGGFIVEHLFGFPAATARADQRMFVGLLAQPGIPSASTEPSSYSSLYQHQFGIGKDSSDTNVFIMSSGAVASATKTDLGVAFTAIKGKMLRLLLICPIGGGTSFTYDLHNIDDNVHYTGTISSNLPGTGTAAGMNSMALVNTGPSVATAVSIRSLKFTQWQNYV